MRDAGQKDGSVRVRAVEWMAMFQLVGGQEQE